MTTMTERERRALVLALARRLRLLARAGCRHGAAPGVPSPPGREPPAAPAREGR